MDVNGETNTVNEESRGTVEAALRQSEQRYRSLVELSPDAILVYRGTRIEYLNPAAIKLFGASGPQQLLGKSLFELFHLDSHALVRQRMERLRQGEPVPLVEEKIVRCDGEEREVAAAAAPFPDGKEIAVQVILRDITEQKRAEKRWLQSEKLAAVGRMAAAVAHEVNNPLAAIMNAVFLARTSGPLPPPVSGYLDIVDEEVKRVARVMQRALGFYRESTLPAAIAVNELVGSAVDLLRAEITAKGVIVEQQCPSGLAVTCVAGELRQVLCNLLANGLDAVGREGVIKVRASNCRGRAGQPSVRITVADNGCGIVRAIRARVFEPFFTTKNASSTGLGLWVSQQIVERLGGSLRLHSRTNPPRRGTVVSMLLPGG
jgi:PAS domain S-box-containing protein